MNMMPLHILGEADARSEIGWFDLIEIICPMYIAHEWLLGALNTFNHTLFSGPTLHLVIGNQQD